RLRRAVPVLEDRGRVHAVGGAGRRRGAQAARVLMAYEFRLPDLGEGLTEGEVARWLVAEGADVQEDDPLVEIQTDKTTVEIPSPASGTVEKILVAEGSVVPVGTVLVVIGGEGVGAAPALAVQPSLAGPVPSGQVRGQTPDVAERAGGGKVRAT